MDPSIMWHLHQANEAWYLVVGNIVAWKALELVKFDNAFYYQTIEKVRILRCYLETNLQFELECLKFCLMVVNLLQLDDFNN
jgi:hypothetical protein